MTAEVKIEKDGDYQFDILAAGEGSNVLSLTPTETGGFENKPLIRGSESVGTIDTDQKVYLYTCIADGLTAGTYTLTYKAKEGTAPDFISAAIINLPTKQEAKTVIDMEDLTNVDADKTINSTTGTYDISTQDDGITACFTVGTGGNNEKNVIIHTGKTIAVTDHESGKIRLSLKGFGSKMFGTKEALNPSQIEFMMKFKFDTLNDGLSFQNYGVGEGFLGELKVKSGGNDGDITFTVPSANNCQTMKAETVNMTANDTEYSIKSIWDFEAGLVTAELYKGSPDDGGELLHSVTSPEVSDLVNSKIVKLQDETVLFETPDQSAGGSVGTQFTITDLNVTYTKR